MAIKYIGYYCNENIRPHRGYPLAGKNKMDYTITKLNELFGEVDIISPSIPDRGERADKGGWFRLNDKTRLRIFCSLRSSNRVTSHFNYLFAQLQLFLFLLTNTKRNEPILVYHSLGYKKYLLWAKKIKKFRLLLELNEIYSDVSVSVKNKRKLENKIIEHADGFLFPNDLMNGMFNKASRPFAVEYGIYRPAPKLSDRFDDGKIHVVYAGTLDPAKGGGVAAAAAAARLPENYHVHILGFGFKEHLDGLKQTIADTRSKAVATITYDGLLKDNEFLAFLQKCHIGLSTQNPDARFNDTSFPSKILTYMANGLHVVSIDIPAISQSRLAPAITFYHEQTPQAIAQAIMNVSNTKTDFDLLNRLDKDLSVQLTKLFLHNDKVPV